MRVHRFLTDQSLTVSSSLTITDRELLHQWSRVLRYTGGEQVILLDGKGTEAQGTLVRCSEREAEVRIESQKVEEASSREPALTLYFSPPKRELTELVFQKGTELGVTRFQPILCQRTVKESYNATRAERILKEATEQSGRIWLPEIVPPISFREALQQLTSEVAFIASLQASDGVRSTQSPIATSSLALFIGPEGGWTEEEEVLASQAGCRPLRLSAYVLRVETACLAGVALLRSASL